MRSRMYGGVGAAVSNGGGYPIYADFISGKRMTIAVCSSMTNSVELRPARPGVLILGTAPHNVTHQWGRANDLQADEKTVHPSSIACDGYPPRYRFSGTASNK